MSKDTRIKKIARITRCSIDIDRMDDASSPCPSKRRLIGAAEALVGTATSDIFTSVTLACGAVVIGRMDGMPAGSAGGGLYPGGWYFYPAPVYPYPDPYVPPVIAVQPAPPVAQAQPQTQSWYYCDRPAGYYPYVTECPSGWKTVPATPPPAAAPGAPPPPMR